MSQPFTAIKLTEDIYWVGAIDWALREFHGYSTQRGTSYNAYLVLADKITLIDTVKKPFRDELFARIASVVNPADIRYIVSNHAEMDHSGCLPEAIEWIRPEKVFASARGVSALQGHFHLDYPFEAVSEDQPLSLGGKTLRFVETRMLHWPDSMFSFLEEDGILFSQDGFGMHYAASERFDDELDRSILDHEAGKYYANILLPFSPMVNAALKKAAGLGIKMIAPDHGPVWRKDPAGIVESYARWAARKPTMKAVVVYDTMWDSTEKMAKAIEDGLVAGGAQVKSLRLRENHRSDIALELLDAGALLVGSPTINNQVYPTVAEFLSYVRGLRPRNLVGAAFGSFGWGGEAPTIIKETLTAMRVEMVDEPLKVQFVPDTEALCRCQALGRQVAEKLKERVAAPSSEE